MKPTRIRLPFLYLVPRTPVGVPPKIDLLPDSPAAQEISPSASTLPTRLRHSESLYLNTDHPGPNPVFPSIVITPPTGPLRLKVAPDVSS